MGSRFGTVVLATFAVSFLASCSSVHIIKVPDGTEGIPFYLPRPYVQVFEPFVIGSKAYLVSGSLSSDGKYLLIDNVRDNGELNDLFKSDFEKEGKSKVPVSIIRKSGSSSPVTALSGGAQGETETNDAPKATDGKGPDPTGAQPVGNSNVSISNTVSQFLPTLGRRFFDIVWMPDFDEKYVIQGKPGLGNSNIGVTMTQGWGLYGLDARVDNSAIVKPLLDFYSTGLDALSKLAKSRILPAGALTDGGAQGAVESANIPSGERVTIKVTRVQVVAPGLYPILKPREVATVTEAATDSPRNSVTRHIPLRPYTNIAFNTYEVVVVEAAKPSGDTPMNLQHYFDQTSADGTIVIPAAPSNVIGGAGGASLDVPSLERRVNALLANRKGNDGAFWEISGLKQEGVTLTGIATLSGGISKPTDLTTMVDLGAFVADHTEAKILPGNVKLTEAKK